MISVLQYIVERVHQKVNRRKVLAQKDEELQLRRQGHVLEGEIKRLNKLLYDSGCLVLEIGKHLREGVRLLGIHEFTQKIPNSELKDNVHRVYYVFDLDSDFFYLRGYVIGEWQPYMSQKPPVGDYDIKHMFRIDGKLRYDDDFERSSCRIQIDHVDTERKYRMLGLARQGFEHLKAIAVEYKARLIYGDMYSGTKEDDGLSEFYRRMGFELSFEEGRLPKFRMEFSLER